MNNKKFIRRIERVGILETNSSSSHSVCICFNYTDEETKSGDYWKLNIDEKGILHIPAPTMEFSWNYFKTNSLETKIQYLFGLFCTENIIEDVDEQKKLKLLNSLLKRILGVSGVKYDFIENYPKGGLIPTIDHQSMDLIEEIYENFDTLKAFLLSPNSWLYGGNDNSDAPENFYEETIKEVACEDIVTVDFDGIGTMDFLVSFEDTEDKIIDYILRDDIVYCIRKSISKNKFELNLDDKSDYLSIIRKLVVKEGKMYLLFVSDKFKSEFNSIKTIDISGEFWEGDYKAVKSFIEKCNLEENIDYTLVPITLKTNKFGIL